MAELSARETMALIYPNLYRTIFHALKRCGRVDLYIEDDGQLYLIRELCFEECFDFEYRSTLFNMAHSLTIQCFGWDRRDWGAPTGE